MTTRWPDEDVEDFKSRLHPNDVPDFEGRLEEEKSELSAGEIRVELKNEIQQYEDHLDLVRAVASGFSHSPIADGFESGYRFAFTEPLEELNTLGIREESTNGDVLLVKEEDNHRDIRLCIVECKAGRSDGTGWVRKLANIKEVIEDYEENLDRLKRQLQLEERNVRSVQYVLLGKIIYIHGVDFERLSDLDDWSSNFAFWGYDFGDFSLVSVHGNVRDPDLAGTVEGGIDALKVENPVQYIYSDHPLIQIKEVIEELIESKNEQDDDYPLEFNQSEFRQTFADGLQIGVSGSERSELIEERVETLLDTGLKIGIFVDERSKINTVRDYRIYFQGEKSNVARDAAQDKYLDEMSKQKVIERAFNEIRGEFEILPEQSTWEDEEWWD